MTQGNIGAWKKRIGDQVSQGDVLVEIETDKAQMDMECQDEGYLAKIFLENGLKDVSVGTPLCILAENKEDIDKFANFVVGGAVAPPPPSTTTTTAPAPAAAASSSSSSSTSTSAAVPGAAQTHAPTIGSHDGRIMASPAARFIAMSKGINLELVKGTGPNGRIVKADVEAFKAPVAPVAATATTAAVPAPSAPSVTAYTPAPSTTQMYEDLPLSNIRKVIASRLTESKQSIPHYYLTVELNAGEVLKLREKLNGTSDGKYKLSLNDFVIKAASLALRDVPEVNSAWQGSFIRQFKSSDICVAVATDTGLITPILSQAEGKGLSSISNQVKELAGRAREGKLAPHEYQGGSFTISNLGMFGVQSFTAIINPPHAAILAVGGIEDKLVLDVSSERGFSSDKVFKVTLSCDHRVVDGAVGAQWLQKFKSYIEKPLTMLL